MSYIRVVRQRSLVLISDASVQQCRAGATRTRGKTMSHAAFRIGSTVAWGLGAWLAAVSAGAQVPADAPDSRGIDEIIITAQKRAENIQDVPAAVTVINGAQIDNSGALNVEGLLSLVPTLNFRESVSTIDSSLFLRGVGTINFSIAAEPSVAFVLDGVVQARAGEAFGDLYDIERIEVLRGPQGTLFGKNSSAGAVNV